MNRKEFLQVGGVIVAVLCMVATLVFLVFGIKSVFFGG
jgi:hypothetical protein